MKRFNSLAKKILLLLGFLAFYMGARAQCSTMGIEAQNYKVCVDNSVVLVAKGVPKGSDYTWHFSNQTITDDLDTVRFIGINTGNFSPYLMVVTPTNLSCKVELPSGKKLEVVGKPAKLELEVSPAKEICSLPQLTTINAKGGSPDLHYTYIIETHGNTASDYLYRSKSARSSVTHRFFDEGYKRVILEIENANGCKTSIVYDSIISAFNLPNHSFSVSDPKTCDKKVVSYKSSLSSSASVIYQWEFEGGKPATSILPNPNDITYEGKGIYGTKLTISNGKGCQKTIEKKDAVIVGQNEIIDINISDNKICIGEEITIKQTGANLDGGTISWTLEGGTVSTSNTKNTIKTVKYNNSGVYDVNINFNMGGCQTDIAYPDTVIVNKIIAAFDPSSYCNCQPDEIQFINKSSSSDPKEILSYQWIIKDNNGSVVFMSKDKSPKYTFTSNGKYSVNLKVTGTNGCTDEANASIRFSPLVADFNVSNSAVCLGESVTASINTNTTCLNNIETIEWTLLDSRGQTITKQNKETFSYTFSKADKYAIELYIKNKSGCEDDKILFYAVDVFQLESSVLTDDEYVCAGDEISLKMSNAPYPVSSTNQWLIIDPSTKARFTGTGSSITFPITEAGTFDVIMIANRNAQCADTVVLEKQFKVSGAKGEIETFKRESCVPFEDFARVKLIYNIQHQNPNNTVSYLWGTSNKSGIEIHNPDQDSTKITITENNYYNLDITLTNGEGCVTHFDKNKAYEAGVIAQFNSNATACLNVPLQTDNRSTINANNYKWLVNDTSVIIKPKIKAEDPRLIFTQVGNYQITLVSKNDLGCVDSFTKQINVIDFDFDFFSNESKSLLCAPALVKFNIEHTNVDSFVWSFGDGDILGSGNTETGHFYDILDLDPDNEYKFDVELVAISKYGCSDTLTKEEYIKLAGPRPNFIATPTVGSQAVEVEFFHFNEGVSYYLFDYGDQSSVDSNQLNKHTYTVSDTSKLYEEYYPKMVAFDDKGCIRSVNGEPIRIYNAAMARFAADTLEACDSVTVKLKNFSSFADSFAWFLNNTDTAFSYLRSPEIRLGNGLHSITLKAYNVAGAVFTEKKKEYISVYKNPVVEMGLDHNFYCTNHKVAFSNQSYGDNEIVKQLWDFNVGNFGKDTSSLENPIFMYAAEGNYSVKLAVEDRFGCKNEKIFVDTVIVGKPKEITHEGLGYVGFLSNNVLNAHISPLDTIGTHGFLIYQELNNVETQLNPIGQLSNKVLSTGNHKLRLNNAKAQYLLKAINDCQDTLAIGNMHQPVLLEVHEGTENFFPVLNWSSYIGWNNTELYRIYRSTDGRKAELLQEVLGNVNTYTDSLVCKNRYEYYVTAVQDFNGYLAQSSFDTLSPAYQNPTGKTDLFTTTVLDDKFILTTWNKHEHPSINRYQIGRTDPNFGYVPLHALTNDTFYIDSIDVYVDRDIYTYEITGLDYCQSKAETSIEGNSIVIALTRTETHIDIEWNSYATWPTDQTWYYLERASETSDFETIYSAKNSTQYRDEDVFVSADENFRYRIKVVYENREAYSNVVNENPDIKIYIPNAFSPNGDGINDVYKVTGSGAQNGSTPDFDKFKLVILNRWGQTVYESNDIYEGWDGNYKGQKVGDAVFVYNVEFRDKTGKFYYMQGNITLLK